MDTIRKAIADLDWDRPTEDQANARSFLMSIQALDLGLLILEGPKSRWENAARIISEFGSPAVDAYLPQLLTWLQDMNWPGARVIFNLLASLPKEALDHHLEVAISAAKLDGDREWLDSLHQLSAVRASP